MNSVFFALVFLASLLLPAGLMVIIVQRIRLNQRLLGEDREELHERLLDELDVLRTQLELVNRKLDRLPGATGADALPGPGDDDPDSPRPPA